jgi:hypothetical protein
MKAHRIPPPPWLAAAAVVVFATYALSFLYFFVDDEGIPYVYAQNILHGKGLSYNAIEGRVEGYSDFLHVWTSTLILAAVRAAGLPKITVFFVGKAISLLAGAGIVLLAWMTMRRMALGRAGASAGLGFLALAGPLAMWSCSSLETVPFALGVTALIAALVFTCDTAAALVAVFLVLERIDGFVYAGTLVAAFLLVADMPRRRELLKRVALPVLALFVAYHGWRLFYFHTLIPAPLASKVLYKLTSHAQLVIKAPDHSYLYRFVEVYGWTLAAAFVAALIRAVSLGGSARALGLAAVPFIAYIAIVGDWMFGFRFFVFVLPLMALILAVAVGSIALTRPRIAAGLALALTLGSGIAARGFLKTYVDVEHGGNFLTSRSRDPRRYFGPYYGLYQTAATMMRPGEVVAYNQAGLIPFMLDLNNIDDMGLCSRFHADLPSTDLYFTETGRYTPLTNRQAIRAGHAYLLYQDALFVMSRTDILERANGGVIPAGLFGGYYDLVATDAHRENAIYRRSGKPAGEFARNPGAFTENLAHVSYLRSASVGGASLSPRDFVARLPFLHDEGGTVEAAGSFVMDVVFAASDERVREVTIAELRMAGAGTLRITLLGTGGRVAARESFAIEAGHAQSIRAAMQPGTAASRLVLELSQAEGPVTRARLTDVRVQGQTPALERFISERLRFPAPSTRARLLPVPPGMEASRATVQQPEARIRTRP